MASSTATRWQPHEMAACAMVVRYIVQRHGGLPSGELCRLVAERLHTQFDIRRSPRDVQQQCIADGRLRPYLEPQPNGRHASSSSLPATRPSSLGPVAPATVHHTSAARVRANDAPPCPLGYVALEACATDEELDAFFQATRDETEAGWAPEPRSLPVSPSPPLVASERAVGQEKLYFLDWTDMTWSYVLVPKMIQKGM